MTRDAYCIPAAGVHVPHLSLVGWHGRNRPVSKIVNTTASLDELLRKGHPYVSIARQVMLCGLCWMLLTRDLHADARREAGCATLPLCNASISDYAYQLGRYHGPCVPNETLPTACAGCVSV